MPIKFLCEHCQAKLQIATRKAGTEQTCPRCKKEFTVPSPEVAEAMLAMKSNDRFAEGGWKDEDFLDFTMYEEQELVYQTDDSNRLGSQKTTAQIDPDRISVPRIAFYMQGAMLGVVACVFFVFGMLVGQSTSKPQISDSDDRMRCRVIGEVTYESNNSQRTDAGATVLLLPTDRRPDPRPPASAFRPGSDLDPTSPDWQLIREIGGDATRVSANGTFELTVSSPREFYLLVISDARSRGDRPIAKDERAGIGRYFVPVEELVGDRDFVWKTVRVTGSNYRLDDITF